MYEDKTCIQIMEEMVERAKKDREVEERDCSVCTHTWLGKRVGDSCTECFNKFREVLERACY